ncbi:MAG: fatty acyl-AMP ligase [Nevskiaceae bacterium]|nr:MAG: fatty acyl-AMP ligase [Nevskiaceae bacterium]TBR74100.1 MAG: fatty acyl-AMP ligase [Nevskiaceae bacterium]
MSDGLTIQPARAAVGGAAETLPQYTTLVDAVEAAAGATTGLAFYSGRGRLEAELSYRQLRDDARALAARLLATGLRPGERVGLVASTDADFVRVFFACQYAALVPAPLPLPAAMGGRKPYLEHIRRMLLAADAAALCGPASLEDWFREAAEGLALRFVGTAAALPETGGPSSLPRTSPDALAYLQFSSGSTRFPRGVAVTQRAVIANTRAIVLHGLCAGLGDRCVSWLPMYHDMGLVGFLLAPLVCHISVDYLPTHEFGRRPLVWLDLISRNRGTLSYSPSFGYELCVRRAEHGLPEGLDLSSWRAAGIGGDMIRPRVLGHFAETFAPAGFDSHAFVASYGMAEASLALSFAPLGHGLQTDCLDSASLERNIVRQMAPTDSGARTRTFVRCGPILPEHEVQVRDGDGRVLGELQVGTLFVRGPSLMREYFGDPDETARTLSAGGWLDTGDLGYLHDGQLVITGRAKDLIVINGRNIWPQDLEWTAEAEVDALRSGGAAAFVVEGEVEDKIVMLVECRSGDQVVRAQMCDAVCGVLSSLHGVTAHVVPVPPRSLPRTSSGKLSRAKAKKLYLKGQLGAVAG